MKNPARLLSAGLATLALAGALTPLVMLGQIGVLRFPLALVLFGLALRAGRSDDDTPGIRGGAWLAWIGAVLVAVAAFQGGSLAFSGVMHRIHPGASAPVASLGDWLAGLVMAVAGAGLLSLGLQACPGFGAAQRGRWFAAAAAVFPASALLFLALSRWWPVSA